MLGPGGTASESSSLRGARGRCLGALLRHRHTRHGLKSRQISVSAGEMRLTSRVNDSAQAYLALRCFTFLHLTGIVVFTN